MQRRTIVLAALLTVALVACADAAPTTPAASVDRGIEHSTGPNDLLLRIGYEGGFTAVEFQLTNLPFFSLYGDGTILTPGPQAEIYPGPALPNIESRHVSEAGIQAILEAAMAAGLDRATDMTDMGGVMIADAPDTVFTLRAQGIDRTVRVYALSDAGGARPPGMPKDEFDARRDLQILVDQMTALDTVLPADATQGQSQTYTATAARVYPGEYRGDAQVPQRPIEWPLQQGLATFGTGDGSYGYRCGEVSGSDWTTLEPLASSANQLSPWRSEDARFAVIFRPLLPDETGC
jgi:hypothetical protein